MKTCYVKTKIPGLDGCYVRHDEEATLDLVQVRMPPDRGVSSKGFGR